MKKSTEKRIDVILKQLINNKKDTTKHLAEMFNVSPEMIRKDLDVLEERGAITRIYGGAKIVDGDFTFSARIYQRKKEKDLICSKAVDLISDGDVVFIDPSTTSLQLGRLIELKKNLTIVTNCIDIIELVSKTKHQIIAIGGKYSKTGRRTTGFFALETLKSLHFNISFFGTDGIKNMQGVATSYEEEVMVNKYIMENSNKNVLMMDSTKFDKESKYVYADFSEFDVLITEQIPEEKIWQDKFKKIIIA